MNVCTLAGLGCVVAVVAVAPTLVAQRGAPGPPVEETVGGRSWTQQSLFQRNIGGSSDQTTYFPPHKIIGNVYDVGIKSLAAQQKAGAL